MPDGIRWGGLTPEDDEIASSIVSRAFRNDPVAGYDRDEFVEMNLVGQGSDPKDERNHRSHLGTLVTKTGNKIVAIPVLKDHGSAGVTGALKNMSHGTVNNVSRSHSTPLPTFATSSSPRWSHTRSSARNLSSRSWTASAASTTGDLLADEGK